MLDGLRDFLRTLSGETPRPREDDPLVAATALLFHVGEADGEASPAERRRLRTLLREHYGLDDAEAARIEREGREADAEAVDLFRFTSVLLRHLGEDERIRFVELLWEIVFADGDVHELEDNIVWRISELLGVSSRDRMLAKREAARRANGGDAA